MQFYYPYLAKQLLNVSNVLLLTHLWNYLVIYFLYSSYDIVNFMQHYVIVNFIFEMIMFVIIERNRSPYLEKNPKKNTNIDYYNPQNKSLSHKSI